MTQKTQWVIHQNNVITKAFTKSLKPGAVSDDLEHSGSQWQPPQPGWKAVNTDACFSSKELPAGCGGIMRDNHGKWIAGFSCMAKVNNIAEAECWAVLKALQWAWRMNYKKIWIQCDSKDVVEWLSKNLSPISPLGNMIASCKEWISKPWEVKVTHVLREQNEIVDVLAKIAIGKRCDWIEFFDPPIEVRDLVQGESCDGRHYRSRDVSRHEAY